MTKRRITIIILARLTSSRLPAKHLRAIAGKPMIFHIVNRLKTIISADNIILSTASENENKQLGDYVHSLGASVRYDEGDENDVTGRVLRTAEEFNSDVFVTVSGDCPLVDPDFIESQIKAIIESGADYTRPKTHDNKCLHEGINTYTKSAYQRIHALSNTWFYKEHPASALRDNRQAFKQIEVEIPNDFKTHFFRMSVDNTADLLFMNQIYHRLGNHNEIIDLHNVVSLLRDEPELLIINSHVQQKKLTDGTNSILYLTRASRSDGFGHLARITALARELLESASIIPILVMPEDIPAFEFADRRGIIPCPIDENFSINMLKDTCQSKKPSAVVIDMNRPLPDSVEEFLDNISIPVVAIDMQPDMFEPDLTIIPAIERDDAPALKRSNTFRGRDWLLIDRMARYYRNTHLHNDQVLVAGGGSIHVFEKLLPRLSNLAEKQSLVFTIGPYIDKPDFDRQLIEANIQNYIIEQNPESPLETYATCKAAILTFGVTAYETISLGIPTFIIHARSEQDRSIVRDLASTGVVYDLVSQMADHSTNLANTLIKLLDDDTLLKSLSICGLDYIDAKGTERISNKIIELIEKATP